jgi:Uncharacterized protein conserved in bacteria (DUF2247)
MTWAWPVRLPAAFVLERSIPTPAEIAWGARRGWTSDQDALEIVLEKVRRGCVVTPAEEELASVLPDESYRISALVDALSVSYESDEARARLWQFLALDWLRQHRDRYADPFELIEMLFAEFDHPTELAGLVRWMPIPKGEDSSIAGLEARWEGYLSSMRNEFKERALAHCTK